MTQPTTIQDILKKDTLRLGLVGFGEVGQIFAQGLTSRVAGVAAWDLKFAAAETTDKASNAALQAAKTLGITPCASASELAAQSDVIISAVTASNTLGVAQALAPHVRKGCVVLDLNSASPATKTACAALIEAAGAAYVEAGVMTSVPPYGIRVPMLLGGPHAAALEPLLHSWGMDVKVASDQLGVASATKMCRSIMIKGLEALVIESFSTARHYGVEDAMIATLQETFPSINWHEQGAYFFSRVVQHGKRRAEEMRESANTVRDAGFEPYMTAAIAAKQQWVADLAAQGVFAGLSTKPSELPQWQAFADRLPKVDKG